ncbi:MAG: manganese ABC transporter ATP-binding protein, partial [Armatimonadetes bacterium]|nr:manganese ABC transporter ATP-binding protein [Armatimonadota bacterium]
MTPALETRNLTVAYDTRPVLLGITLAVERGQVIGVIGPNGAG